MPDDHLRRKWSIRPTTNADDGVVIHCKWSFKAGPWRREARASPDYGSSVQFSRIDFTSAMYGKSLRDLL